MKSGLTIAALVLLFCFFNNPVFANNQRGGNNQDGRAERQQNQRQMGRNRQGPGEPGRRDRQGPPPHQASSDASELFNQFDRNSDGRLTRNEVPRERRQQLAAMDVNGDGACDLAEFESALDRQMGQHQNQRGQQGTSAAAFSQFDQNGDGLISPNEVPQNARQQFANIDANGDGACDKSEMDAAMENPAGGQRGSGQRGTGQRQGHGGNQTGRGGRNGEQSQRGSNQIGGGAQRRGSSQNIGGGRTGRGGGGRGGRGGR